MHETMIAQSLLAAISEEAAKRNAKPVAAKISCGKLNPVNDDVLSFAFEAIAQGTLCEGTKIKVEHKPIQARCKDCNYDFEIELSQPRCSQCGSENFELLPDVPLMLEEIEFQED